MVQLISGPNQVVFFFEVLYGNGWTLRKPRLPIDFLGSNNANQREPLTYVLAQRDFWKHQLWMRTSAVATVRSQLRKNPPTFS